MLLSTILLCIAVIGSFLWLACTLAVFATPLFTGFFVGGWASQAGASLPEAMIVGSIGAALMLCAGRFFAIVVRPTWARLSIMAIFVMPAVIAGYHVMHGIVKQITPSASLQIAFSIMAAIVIGVIVFRHFVEIATAPSGPRLLGPDRHSDRDDVTETCSDTAVVIVGVAAAASVRGISSASATQQAHCREDSQRRLFLESRLASVMGLSRRNAAGGIGKLNLKSGKDVAGSPTSFPL